MYNSFWCSKYSNKYITKNHGFYVAPVKGNQPTLEENIQLFFADEHNYKKEIGKNYYEITEKTHGTVETREYLFSNDIDWLYQKGEWQIENGLHLYLDMVFLEDKNKCFLENI